MFTSFFKNTLRNLWKNKTYSFLNIFGLAIGVACSGLIFLWVEDELNFDSVHLKKDRLYEIYHSENYDGVIRTMNSTPGLMSQAMKTEVKGIANICRLNYAQPLFNLGDKSIYENGIYADSSLFSMFSTQFVQGNARNAFAQLYSMVISEKMARHFFGNEKDVLGKTLKADNQQNYVITGVMKDLPANTSMRYDWIAPMEIYVNQNPSMQNWGSYGTNTYVELLPGTDPSSVNRQLIGLIQKRVPEAGTIPVLFSMEDWHLRSDFENGKITGGGRIQYVRMFTFIAWIILLIACINFMNLATARSEKRAKEVGVRKVLGAGRSKLILQFIGEAVFMSAIAVLAGVFILLFALPAYNQLVQKELSANLYEPLHFGALLVIAILCGIIAGSYPALYLSSFNPVSVFKGLKIKHGGATLVRKGLVVIQFTISIILIISTIIIYQQIEYVKSRDTGYNKNNLVSTSVRGDMIKNFSVIKQQLMNTGLIENVGLNSLNPLSDGDNGSNLTWQGKDPNKQVLISYRQVSPEMISTLGLKVLEGRDFNTDAETDSTNVIITRSFEKVMGGGSAVGKVLQVLPKLDMKFTVVGVVNDYVYGDMYKEPDPVIFLCMPKYTSLMYMRLKPESKTVETLAKIESVIKKANPGYPFEYNFVDDQFNQQFMGEMLIGKLSRVFATLAIIISCLGLFGLAAFTAERRTKEIGIRKVLGASVAGITRLLSKDFLRLVFISALISFPVAWWVMNSWLDNYAYRITISWWVFIVAGLLAVVIALLTISFQSIRAALMNPVKSLRTD